MSKNRFIRHKPDRQGVVPPGRSRQDNEFSPKQRNPEPTTAITEPPLPPDASQPLRVDMANNLQPAYAAPPPPMPHDDVRWASSPQGFFMRTLERLALAEIQGAQVKDEFVDWLKDCEGEIDRQQLITQIEFLHGRLLRGLPTTLEGFYRAVAAVTIK